MEVILLTDVDKVGLRGEVVNVSRGFMRNYLAPRRLAEPATPARVAELAKREADRARHEARSFEQAQEIAGTLRKTVLRFDVQAGPRGTLFGSVTATDLADELWRTRKIRVDRRKIELPDPIKRIGRYEIPIDVFQDVRVEVKTLVVPEGGELPPEEELQALEAEEAVGAVTEPTEAAETVPTGEETDAWPAEAEAAGVPAGPVAREHPLQEP
jgi:large subunit ribosomal protein L9